MQYFVLSGEFYKQHGDRLIKASHPPPGQLIDWSEEKHPRGEDGKFKTGDGEAGVRPELKDYVDRAQAAAKAEKFKDWSKIITEVYKNFGNKDGQAVTLAAQYEADVDEDEEPEEEELIFQVQGAVEDLDEDQLRKVMELIKSFKK